MHVVRRDAYGEKNDFLYRLCKLGVRVHGDKIFFK